MSVAFIKFISVEYVERDTRLSASTTVSEMISMSCSINAVWSTLLGQLVCQFHTM